MSIKVFLIFLQIYSLHGEINSKAYVRLQILEGRQLFPYRAYKDVQIFHYDIPLQVGHASFQYKANGSYHCTPKPVAVYLQYGSYPVINPNNSSFPESFIVKRQHLHNITLMSDMSPAYLNISNPIPGSWYAAAFLLENTDRIAQKGLFIPCTAWLSTHVEMEIYGHIKSIVTEAQILQEITNNEIYRYFAYNDTWSSDLNVEECEPKVNGKCPIILRAKPRAFPHFETMSSTVDTQVVNCSEVDNCSMKFVPAVEDWNYISIETLQNEKLNLTYSFSSNACENHNFVFFNGSSSENLTTFDESEVLNWNGTLQKGSDTVGMLLQNYDSGKAICWPNVPLVRISMATNLAYEYNLPPVAETYPLILNISNNSPTFTFFRVQPAVDIGGTLVIDLAISPVMNVTSNNVSVLGCLTYGIRPQKVEESYICESSTMLLVNSSEWENRLATVYIPYPEAGLWYFSLFPKCYINGNNNTEVNTVPCDMKMTSVFLRIRSSPCILGQCGEYGTCYQYVSGGFIFSTCNCIAGWRGWGCTDGTAAHSNRELLIDVLLLTLSNLLFIPTIILSVQQKYFTEAFVYFTTMVFSSFYHACDAEVYSYCLIRLSVLQFCDFYSAILSIWVTLIAMAELPQWSHSLVHMIGAIGVALGVEYDRTGLWVIVLPAGIGFSILMTSWITRCVRTRVCFPKRRTWLTSLLPGTVLALCGLVTYAFFETKDNYPYVHSAWHAAIALSVLFLLPKKIVQEKGSTEGLMLS